jgi:hypothetical protein
MVTGEQKAQYFRDGYLLVRNVLTAEEVHWLRAFFRPKFDAPRLAPDTDHWLLDIFGRYPEVRWLCFHEPSLSIVRALFGDDIVLLPESTVHFNYFGRWHKDTGSFDRAGLTFFKAKEFLQWTVAYYLQDNTAEYGGGLDVEPGSHRQAEDPFIRPTDRRSIWKRIWHQLDRAARRKYWLEWNRHGGYVPSKVVSVPSCAGDMVIFDSRLNHHATPAPGLVPVRGWIRRGLLPTDHEKLAVFSSWSKDNSTARAYMDWTRARWEYPHLKNFSYPADFLVDAEKAGVKLVY